MVFHPRKNLIALSFFFLSLSLLLLLLSIVILLLLRGWLGTTPTTDLIIPAIKKLYQSGSFFISPFRTLNLSLSFCLHSLLKPQVLVYSFFSSSTSSCRCTSASYESRRLVARTRNSEF